MDIYCPSCGEPWDMDMLHAVPGMSYATARRRFPTEGCALFETRHNTPPNEDLAAQAAVLHDLLGDDIDGIAAEMEDWAA